MAVQVEQRGAGFDPDAGQRFVGPGRLQGGQAGVERFQLSAALGGKAGAKAIGAELRACIAAHGADDGIGMERLVAALGTVEEDGVAVPVLAQGVDGAASAHLHPQPGHVALQQGEDVRCLIGIRVDPPGFVGAGVKPQRPEPFQRRGGVHGVQQRGQRLWVCGEITRRCDAGVAEVAPAVAGGQQLFAAAGVAVQHGDAHCPGGGRLCCGQRCRHPGRTAA